MTIHIVGTSHILPLRQSLSNNGEGAGFEWYFANNTEYQAGEFIWTDEGLSHTAHGVTAIWEKLSRRRSVPIKAGDTVVAFGFDDRYDRYSFLAGNTDHVSSACRAQAMRDLVAESPALRMVALVRENQPRARAIMVEPPLLSRSEQLRKFVDHMVLKHRLHELCSQHAAVAKRYDAGYLVQAVETLQIEGDYIYTREEFMAPDGFHWGESGIETVRRDLMPALGLQAA
ncbi:hypothetical protein ADU59_17415 [Pararhizobium polonicum]|uniref:Uncharacterized protein n=1 Tax=Pararhizobium polonicum TaxID=1612624 RepID=A0A1C7NZR2_9HYPH|nr:hypothetical protein [Pararhizobium polonicum]OBZ94440.1 hypothetical protein ADU59_17415 [Pararhizobium polonicum]